MIRIEAMPDRTRPIPLEGRVRTAFLRDALDAAGLASAHLMRMDCDDTVRTRRLVRERRQPERARSDMMAWAQALRRGANEVGCEVPDTSVAPLARSVEVVRARLGVGGRSIRAEAANLAPARVWALRRRTPRR